MKPALVAAFACALVLQTVACGSGSLHPLPALLVASAASVNFGSVFIEESLQSTSQVQLTNPGGLPLTIQSIQIVNDLLGGSFSQTNDCGNSLAPGNSCLVSIVYAPAFTGGETASLSVSTNASSNPLTIALSGAGATTAGLVSFSPSSLSFGAQIVSSASAPKTITLTSLYSQPLYINLSPTQNPFVSTTTCGSTLAAGATCTVIFIFEPSRTGLQGPGVFLSISTVPTSLGNTVGIPVSGVGLGSGGGSELLYSPSLAGLSGFNVNSDGTLGELAVSPFPQNILDGLGPYNGGLVYSNSTIYDVSASPPQVVVLHVSFPSGALTSVQNLTLSGSGQSLYAAFAPGFFYETLNTGGSDQVNGFAIAADGTLSALPASPFSLSSVLWGLATDPPGKFLLALSNQAGANQLGVLAIDPASGGLTPVSGSPFSVTGSFLTTDPTGKFLYFWSSGVWAYSIDLNGQVTLVQGSPFVPGTEVSSLIPVAGSSGNFLYAITLGGITGYSIDNVTGAVASVPDSTVALVNDPVDLVSDGKFLYVVTAIRGSITGYAISASGALTEVLGAGAYLPGTLQAVIANDLNSRAANLGR